MQKRKTLNQERLGLETTVHAVSSETKAHRAYGEDAPLISHRCMVQTAATKRTQEIVVGDLRDINSTALHMKHPALTLLAEEKANPKHPEAHLSDSSVGYHISTVAPHHLNYRDVHAAHLGKDGDRIGPTSIHGQHAVQACHHVLAGRKQDAADMRDMSLGKGQQQVPGDIVPTLHAAKEVGPPTASTAVGPPVLPVLPHNQQAAVHRKMVTAS